MGKAAGARMMVRPRGGAPRHGRPLITPTPARAGGGATASYPASAAATPINYAKRHGPLRARLPIEPGARPVLPHASRALGNLALQYVLAAWPRAFGWHQPLPSPSSRGGWWPPGGRGMGREKGGAWSRPGAQRRLHRGPAPELAHWPPRPAGRAVARVWGCRARAGRPLPRHVADAVAWRAGSPRKKLWLGNRTMDFALRCSSSSSKGNTKIFPRHRSLI